MTRRDKILLALWFVLLLVCFQAPYAHLIWASSYNPVFAPTILQENLDGTGYQQGALWVETVATNATLDEDSTDARTETGFSGQWLRITALGPVTGTTQASITLPFTTDTAAVRAYAIASPVLACGATRTFENSADIVSFKDSAGNNLARILAEYGCETGLPTNSGLSLYIGAARVDSIFPLPATAARYEISITDSTNAWEWTVDGTSQGSGTQAFAGPIARVVLGGEYNSSTGISELQVYIDGVRVTTSGWNGVDP